MWASIVVFFLQAEGGIRDWTVTGVQACALPISSTEMPLPNNWILGQVSGISVDADDHVWPLQRPGSLTERSEERRVGKSVDLGGRRIIKKKKDVHPSDLAPIDHTLVLPAQHSPH